jgi:hypothetical protein
MKKQRILFQTFGGIILAVLWVAVLYSFANPFVSNGNTDRQTRNVDEFSRVYLSVDATLYITQGSPQKLEIEADPDVLADIETEVNGESLNIKTQKNLRNKTITVYITVPEIEGLGVAGSGTILGQGKISADDLDLEVAGSGKIELSDVSAAELSADIAGSGDIQVSGTASDELEVEIAGSGNFKGSDLEAKEVEIHIAGSGSTWVNASSSLDVEIAGSGDVYYKGSPQINSSIVGSGNIKKD